MCVGVCVGVCVCVGGWVTKAIGNGVSGVGETGNGGKESFGNSIITKWNGDRTT